MDEEIMDSQSPPTKTDVQTLIPYIGRYFKNKDYYFRPYRLEYVDGNNTPTWYTKAERVSCSDVHWQNQLDIQWYYQFDIDSEVWRGEEITKEEFDKAKERVKILHGRFGTFWNHFTETELKDIKAVTRREFSEHLSTIISKRKIYLFHWAAKGAFRLEEIVVRKGEIIETLTYQFTYDYKEVHFKPEYWLCFFDTGEKNRHKLDLYWKEGRCNFIWVLVPSKFIKLKNIIKNPLNYIEYEQV